MGVLKTHVTATLLDTDAEVPACFVLICLCCYNLGRLNHETRAFYNRDDDRILFQCDTCRAQLAVEL